MNTIEQIVKTQKSHPRQWVDVSIPTYQLRARPSENPTHGSGVDSSDPAYGPREFEVIIGRRKVGSEPSTHFSWVVFDGQSSTVPM